MQAKLMLWVLSVGVVFALFFGAYKYGRHVEGLERDKIQNEAIIKVQTKLKEATEQNDKDKLTIAKLSIAPRLLRIHIPCTLPTQASDTSGASGVLPTDMDDTFARLQFGVESLIERCESLNADAIKANKLN